MDAPVSNRVTVTINPDFWELLAASLSVIRYQPALWIVHAIFPAAGLFILIVPAYMGRPPEVIQILIGLMSLFFTPLILALTIWLTWRGKLAKGPFTICFDGEGVRTSSLTFEQTIKWPAILKARQSRRFLFVFITPSRAIMIPLRALREQNVFEEVRSLVAQNTDFRE